MNKFHCLALALTVGSAGAVFAAEPPPKDVIVLDHAQMNANFAKGGSLLENSSFKLAAARRITAARQAELHEHDTDIFYIVEGTGTLVTGGQMEGGKASGPGEMRGTKITGGKPRALQKGAVVVIPKGVPHQFTEVTNPFLYFVVKVTD